MIDYITPDFGRALNIYLQKCQAVCCGSKLLYSQKMGFKQKQTY